MEEATSVGTGNSLIRQCIYILDAIYTNYNFVEFISTLHLIEVNLFENLYESVESFKNAILSIPQITPEFIDRIDLSAQTKVPEEYCTTPIYSSIQCRKESLMYSVNIKSHQGIHFPLHDAIKQPSKLPTHRLHIIKNSHFLLDARDHISNFLALFFDVELMESTENPNFSHIKANVAIVHPLGELHESSLEEFEGWMKVKIAFTNSINTVIPTKLARRLFEKKEQIARKVSLKPAKDVVAAADSELTRQFVRNITDSRVDRFESCYNLTIQNLLNVQSKYTPPPSSSDKSTITTLPNLYQSASNMLSLLTDTKPKEINIMDVTPKVQVNDSQPVEVQDTENSFEKHWKRLARFCHEKNSSIISKTKYDTYFKRSIDAEGYFKHVYFTQDNDVLQVFRRSTASQRVVEIASLLALKDKEHIGQIKDIIHDEAGKEMIGLTMERYDMTLKSYLKSHAHQRLSAKKRMDIILQMLKSLQEAHQLGIAHRDLSSVNFMVNAKTPNDQPRLYLIDFGKAVFFSPRDAKKWWVDCNDNSLYKDEVKPATKEELAIWCKNLPFVMARPDHGYRFYRSIQTLPRNGRDHDLLPYLIDPAAEDIYSLGTMVWKIFLGIEPWPGVFDTDLKSLRETVSRDYYIDQVLDRAMPGPMSKAFLQMFLRVQPQNRKSAAEILFWVQQDDVQKALLEEWGCEDGSRRAARNNNFCKVDAPKPIIKKQARKAVVLAPTSKPVIPKAAPINAAPLNATPVRAKPGRPPSLPKIVDKVTGRACFPSGLPIGRPPSKIQVSKAEKMEKIIIRDGIKYFSKSGVPVGRPKRKAPEEKPVVEKPVIEKLVEERPVEEKPMEEKPAERKPAEGMEEPPLKRAGLYQGYVKTGKPRGRPKKVGRDGKSNVVRPIEMQLMPNPNLNLMQKDKITKQYKAEPLIIKLPTSNSSQADNLLHSPILSPEPPIISRPPSLSPLPDHSRQSSQSTCLSLSPVSNENVEGGDASHKRKFEEEDDDEPASPKRIHLDHSQEEKSKDPPKAQQYIDTTDEFDRALYYILRDLGLPSLPPPLPK